MLASEICDVAADLIEARGWTTGTHEDVEGRLCVMGACHVAASAWTSEASIDQLPGFYQLHQLGDKRLPLHMESYFAALRAVREMAGGCENIATWNDLVANGEKEVIDVLRTAGEKLRTESA